MTEALVPHDGLFVLPTVVNEDRVDVGPADLRVKEPERRGELGEPGPFLNVRAVPVRKSVWGARVAWEAADPVGAVGDDHVRCPPGLVGVKCVADVELEFH